VVPARGHNTASQRSHGGSRAEKELGRPRKPRASARGRSGRQRNGPKEQHGQRPRRAALRGRKVFGSPGTGPEEVMREARCRRGGRWEVTPT
ncbi:unnamed protein product, partial [Gulo gulo]